MANTFFSGGNQPTPPTPPAGEVQYEEGATTTPATGTVALGRSTAGTLVPLPIGEGGGVVTEFSTGFVYVNSTLGGTFAPDAADYDTGAGTRTTSMVGMALPASGGAVAGGTSTNPIRVDPTGVTAQPISGTVTLNLPEDRDAFTSGTTNVLPIAGVYDDALPGLSAGMIGTPRMNNIRALYTNLRQGNYAGNAVEIQAGALSDLKIFTAVKGGGSGNITANGQVVGSTNFTTSDSASMGEVTVTISGVWSGTLQFEAPLSTPIPAINLVTGVVATTTTTNGTFSFALAGLQSFRVISTAWVSGTATVDATSGFQLRTVALGTPLPPGANVIGHVIADTGSTTAVTGNVTVIQGAGTNLHTVVDSGVITSVTSLTNALPAGDNNIGNVDIVTVPAPLSTTGGGTEATALRVTVATDSTGVLSVDDNGASLTVDNATISVVGGGTEATAQRVTIANDSTGVLSVDDNGGSFTVDQATGTNLHTVVDSGNIAVTGSVTANAGTNLNTSALALETTQLAQLSRADTFKTRSDIFTSTTNGVTIDCSASPVSAFGIQIKGTGAAATTWDVRLEGGLNNVDFTPILTHTQVTGDGTTMWTGALEAPTLYFRSRVAGLVLGPATNVVVTVLGQN